MNDFDEAYEMPYTNDLVRLAASVALAIEERHLGISRKSAYDSLMEGYQAGLAAGGHPFVLEERHTWLRSIAMSELRDSVGFWEKMDSLPPVKGSISLTAADALNHLLPEKNLTCRIVSRVAGLGSLGHRRLVAIARWHGARIAREAKALVPSACYWVGKAGETPEIMYPAIIARAIRCPDPFVQLRGKWIVRRLSPHCSRIDLDALPADRDELKLLGAMGWETANIHLGTPKAARGIERHLKKMRAGWLRTAADEMTKAVRTDWQAGKRSA